MTALTKEAVLACPNLPSLPVVAVEVLELTRDEEAGVDEIAAVVQNDPALTAKILKTINSSYYALPTPCTTILRALTYMGLSTVKSLVLGFSLATVTEQGGREFQIASYWRRCLYAAAAAQRIAKLHGRVDAEEAFAAALVQDLGMLAIHAADSGYGEVVGRTHGDHGRLCEAERAVYGFDHAEIGGLLGERWRLPDAFVDTVRHHHDGENETDHADLVRTTCLASEVATAMDLPTPGPAVTRLRARAEVWFELEAAVVNDLLQDIGADAEELGRLFEVSTGAPVDVNWLLAEAEEASVVHQLALEHETETLRRTNDELAREAVTDPLTRVGNRRRFDEELRSRFDQASAFRGSLGVIIIDADRFKSVNDDHGHQVGDVVLIELANRMKTAVRGVDFVCRYGGEEFGVVLPGASVRDVATIAERLRVAVEERPFDLSVVPGAVASVSVTVSLGVAVYDTESARVLTSPGLLVKAADRALYVAKDSGRNCARVFRAGAPPSNAA